MPNDLVVKTFRGFEIKDAEKGEVEAKVATLEVIDKDGDIIRRGSQGKAAKVAMSSWGHDAMFGNRPAGKGKLVEENGTLKFTGRVFLNTTDGRETFEVLKEMGEDQEWSFGFRVLGSEVPTEAERKAGASRIITKIDAFEVSPVLIGAGVGTQTTRVKAPMQMGMNQPPGGSEQAPDDDMGPPSGYMIGDRVRVRAGAEHDPMMRGMSGTVRVVSTPALGIKFDDMDGIHRWYVAEELEREESKSARDLAAREEELLAAEAAALEEAKAAETTAAVKEFERFQRTQHTMRRAGLVA